MPIRPSTSCSGAESDLMWKSPVLFFCMSADWLLQGSFPELIMTDQSARKARGKRKFLFSSRCHVSLQKRRSWLLSAEEQHLGPFPYCSVVPPLEEGLASLSLPCMSTFFMGLKHLDKRRPAQPGATLLGKQLVRCTAWISKVDA